MRKQKEQPTMTGWKVFDKDLKCRNYQFEVGKRFKESGDPKLCCNGFHFHFDKSHLFNYYQFDSSNRVCEIIAYGNVDKGDDKACCCDIEIIKELSWQEVLSLVNIGKDNTGRNNTGNGNTGNLNTGNRNTGNRNTGDWNTGNGNTGYMNTGNGNTGHRNTGNWNTGDFNSTNFSSGLFNSTEQPVTLFNGAATVMMSEFRNTKNYKALYSSPFLLTEWVYESDMTDEEKKDNPMFYVAEGYLKKRTYKEACALWWEKMTKENKQLIKEIPGFTPSIFTEITGIEL